MISLRVWYPAMAEKWERRLADLKTAGVKTVYQPSERRGYVIHHTAGGAGVDPRSYARRVADMHWNSWKRPGGYQWMIGLDGQTYEMSGLLHIGAHAGTSEWNRAGLGLAFQGDYTSRLPNPGMLEAAAGIIASSGAPHAQWGHRDVRPSPTSCPGNTLYAHMPLEDDMPTPEEIAAAVWNFQDWDPVRGDNTPENRTSQREKLRHIRSDVRLSRTKLASMLAGSASAGAIARELILQLGG